MEATIWRDLGDEYVVDGLTALVDAATRKRATADQRIIELEV